MLGIVAVMDQKEFLAFLNLGSGMCKARIAGFTPRYVFSLVVGRPAGRSVWTRRTIMLLAGSTGDDTSCAVISSFSSGPDAPHHGRYEPEGFFKFVDIPFVAQEAVPHGPDSLQTTEIPQLPFVFRWLMSLLCRSCLPYPLLSRTGAQVQTLQYTVEVPQLLFIKVVDNSLLWCRGRFPWSL